MKKHTRVFIISLLMVIGAAVLLDAKTFWGVFMIVWSYKVGESKNGEFL